ncbi:MAG: DsbA family oxidoreductase [Alphaproteobacteria bacterium]|nr:DsbA family oxidoreductase [Alphaproteobacteria bacterium]
MQIDIVSDTICPWCFVGKRRFERALELRPQTDLSLTWRPYQLNPTMPNEGIDRKAYLSAKFGGLDRAERSYDRLREAGAEVGIEFRFDEIDMTPNTINTHRLIQYAKSYNASDALIVEKLYVAYFLEARNIGDINVLQDISIEAGLDGEAFARYIRSDDDRAYILEQDEAIRRQGITGVPCFIVEGKYAVSGAQSPEIFHQIFDLVHQEELAASAQSAAE